MSGRMEFRSNSRIAWNPNLAVDLPGQELDKYKLVPVLHLDEFVTEPTCTKRILVGPKGSGKTLALAKRARLLGTSSSHQLVLEHTPYFSKPVGVFSEVPGNKDLAEAGRSQYWAWTWKLVAGALLG